MATLKKPATSEPTFEFKIDFQKIEGFQAKKEMQHDRLETEDLGNGELDIECVLNGDTKCWRHRIPQQEQSEKKRKIILNNWEFLFFNVDKLCSTEKTMLEQMLAEYDVSLWQEEPPALKKITTLQELETIATRLTPSSSSSIKPFLKKNNYRLDDYFIIGRNEYLEVLNKTVAQIYGFETILHFQLEELRTKALIDNKKTINIHKYNLIDFPPGTLQKISDAFSSYQPCTTLIMGEGGTIDEVLSVLKQHPIQTLNLEKMPLTETELEKFIEDLPDTVHSLYIGPPLPNRPGSPTQTSSKQQERIKKLKKIYINGKDIYQLRNIDFTQPIMDNIKKFTENSIIKSNSQPFTGKSSIHKIESKNQPKLFEQLKLFDYPNPIIHSTGTKTDKDIEEIKPLSDNHSLSLSNQQFSNLKKLQPKQKELKKNISEIKFGNSPMLDSSISDLLKPRTKNENILEISYAVSNEKLEEKLSENQDIKELNLHDNRKIPYDSDDVTINWDLFLKKPHPLPHLNVLSLKDNNFSGKNIASLLKKYPHIKTLSIKEIFRWDGFDMTVFSELKHLTSLEIYEKITDDNLEDILSHSHSLRKLKINLRETAGDIFDKDNEKTYPNIASLDLMNSILTTAQFERLLLKFPNLQVLAFSYTSRNNEKRLHQVIENLKNNNLLSEKTVIIPQKNTKSYDDKIDDLRPSDMNEFSEDARPLFDEETKTPSDKSLDAKIHFIDNENKSVDPRQYRLNVSIDPFENEQTTKTINPQEIPLLEKKELLAQFKKSDKNTYFGQHTATIDKKKWVPLPSLIEKDTPCFYKPAITHIENIPNLLVGHEPSTGMYYIKLDERAESRTETVTLHYLLNTNPQKLDHKDHHQLEIDSSKEHPDIFAFMLSLYNDKKYAPFNSLLEEINDSKDSSDIISKLINYTHAFENENLEEDAFLDELLELYPFEKTPMRILAQQKGACRHRANSIAYLLHLLGFKNVCIEINDVHAFISFYDPNTQSHLAVDLGGHSGAIIEKAFDFKTAYAVKEKLDLAQIKEKREKQKNEYQEDDKQKLHLKVEENKSITEFWEKRLSNKKAQLLWAENANDARLIYSSFLSHLKATHNPLQGNTLYIDSADTLRQLLWDTQITTDGAYKKVPGALQNLIIHAKQQGTPAVIVVNWAQFSAAEIALYKSMMDDIRKIGPFILPKSVRIIGVTTPDAPKTDAFLSRINENCHSRFPLELAQTENLSNTNSISKTPLTIDLLGSPDAKNILTGKIGISRKKFTREYSIVVQALKENVPLVITNPPERNKDFETFIHRLSTEKKIQINGESFEIPEGFSISIEKTPYTFKTQNIVFLYSDEQTDKKKDHKTYPLNQSTFPLFLKNIRINENNEGENVDGYLSQYREGDDIIVTETLSDSQWAQILEKIEKTNAAKEKSINFRFLINNGVATPEKFSMPTVEKTAPENLNLLERPKGSFLTTSSDPDYTVELLQQQLNVPSKNVIHISERTAPSELFESTHAHMDNNELIFDRKVQETYKKLAKGETVILSGSCSQSLYNQIVSLFGEPSGLWLNGDYHELPGKLIVVSPEKNKLSSTAHFNHAVSLLDYKNHFDKLYPTEHVEQVFLFFTEMKKLPPITDSSGPSEPVITEKRFKMLLEALKDKKDNPAKPIILRDYHGEAYKKRLAIAKRIFSEKKLTLSENQKLHKPTHIEKRQKLIKEAIDNPAHKIILFKGIPGSGKTFIRDSWKNKKELSLYNSENEIEKWLSDENKDNKATLLFLDEANLNPQDYWNLLKGLKKEPPSIFYKGKLYPVSTQHKVILTGNPEHFPKRHYLDIQDIIHTINFKPLSRSFLEEKIVNPLITKAMLSVDSTSACKAMLDAYESMRALFPYKTLSARDVESMIVRYITLCKRNPLKKYKNPLKIACTSIAETFRQHFDTEDKLIEWVNTQAKTSFSGNDLSLVTVSQKTEEDEAYIIVPSRQKIIDSVQLDLEMLENEQKGKRGILFEGPSGIGKSALARKILKDTKKDYIHINAGEEDPDTLSKKLIAAFHEGKYVLLDEYNIQPLESVLNHLLSGVDPDGNPAKNAGFFIFLTGNPATTHEGHKELSEAEMNRLEIVHMKSYTHKELCDIALTKFGIPENIAYKLIKESKNMSWSTDRSCFHAFEEYEKENRHSLLKEKDISDEDMHKPIPKK